MNNQDSSNKKIRKVRQLRLPIITFDKKLDDELHKRGIETAPDSDGQLDDYQVEHTMNMFDYMTDIGLIPLED